MKAVDAAQAREMGRFTDGGIDICLRPWRCLAHALGFRMFYSVHLFLDGIPDHAWTLVIVERVIGHQCALQYIVTDLVKPEDTRHIELWAWTPEPRGVPRRSGWRLHTARHGVPLQSTSTPSHRQPLGIKVIGLQSSSICPFWKTTRR